MLTHPKKFAGPAYIHIDFSDLKSVERSFYRLEPLYRGIGLAEPRIYNTQVKIQEA